MGLSSLATGSVLVTLCTQDPLPALASHPRHFRPGYTPESRWDPITPVPNKPPPQLMSACLTLFLFWAQRVLLAYRSVTGHL